MSILAEYKIIDPQIYLYLRESCLLSPKTLEAAKIGLDHSLCCVVLTDIETNQVVGMGRLIGDGACHCEVVDICVLPAYQKRGLGKIVMQKLDDYIQKNLPESCYVGLLAENNQSKLYEKYGFKTANNAQAMGYTLGNPDQMNEPKA